MIKRYTLIKMHIMMASVIFPMTVMFFITGVLYISDIKPETSTDSFRITLDQPMQQNADKLKQIAKDELAKREISAPLGRVKLKWDSDLDIYYLFWDGENRWLKIRPSTRDQHVAVIKVFTPSWYGRFMSMHKGNGKDSFNYSVIAMVVVMMLTILSGTMMGLSLPKQRKRVIYSMLTGTFLFLALVLYSQFV
ncbi:MAG: hypothetical protein Q9M17_00620 [Mariprofundus sp.]|nr:hypothetical protein [Mariprofundus sp.]